jgi:hypothetical protein
MPSQDLRDNKTNTPSQLLHLNMNPVSAHHWRSSINPNPAKANKYICFLL